MKNIAVFAFPIGTHAAPLFSFIRQISTAAPDIKFFFFSTAESNAAIFSKEETLDKIIPCNVWNGCPEGYVFKGNPVELAGYFVKSLPGNFKEAMNKFVAETGTRFDSFITDAFYWFGSEFAEELSVPWLPLWTSGPRPLLVHMETDQIRQHLGVAGVQTRDDKTLDFLPEFSKIRASDLPDDIVSDKMHSPFSEMTYKMGLALPRATAVLVNSFDELDTVIVDMLKSRIQNKFLNVGPFCLTLPPKLSDPHGCIDWLNGQELKASSVAYISFGSVGMLPPQELVALADALEELGTPYIWSFRGNPEQLLPKYFMDNTKNKGMIVPWVPQLKLLQHPSIGVFVTHCGWNSVLESIVGGVPLIARPIFGEQKLNSRIVEAVWGTGLGMEGGVLTKDGMVKALKLVLSSEEGGNMRNNIELQKQLAFKAVEEPNGSSTENFMTLLNIISNSSV